MTEPTKTQCLSIYVDEQDAKSYRCLKLAGHGTEHLHGDWVWWDKPEIPSAKPEPSEGARRAAEKISKELRLVGPGTDVWLAAIIDRETHSAEMRKALEHMEGLFFQPYFSGTDSEGKPASQGVCAKCHHFIPSYSEVHNPEYHTADCEFLAALKGGAL